MVLLAVVGVLSEEFSTIDSQALSPVLDSSHVEGRCVLLAHHLTLELIIVVYTLRVV